MIGNIINNKGGSSSAKETIVITFTMEDLGVINWEYVSKYDVLDYLKVQNFKEEKDKNYIYKLVEPKAG